MAHETDERPAQDLAGIGDEAFDRAMARVEDDLEREVGTCSSEEYDAFLRANLKLAEADIAAGRVISNDEVMRRSAERREERLRGTFEQTEKA